LDAVEDSDTAIEADANIPDEDRKLQELIDLVDEAPDRKLHTLVRAIEQLRRENPREKIIIFTQYRETLFFIRDELANYYGESTVSTLKGGPLEDKIAACESFWEEDGTQFLISTTAGGEGINLQVARILFNYDLPWNPMAVEQRIGRIHRYGQTETAQVYSLVAEDTIEEKVYDILERKLWEIANTIGKIDTQTGEVTEDFRSEVLGYLSSAVNYNDLYREALVNKDYQRTEREIEDALKQAKKASDALRELTQDLTTFNLEQYSKLKGKYTLDDLKLFTQKAVISLGGSFIPSGEIIKIVTPNVLLDHPRVSSKYDNVTFSRRTATRKKGVELLGLGHPLIDALLAYYKSEHIDGQVLIMDNLGEDFLSLRCLFEIDFTDGTKRTLYEELPLHRTAPACDIDLLKGQYSVGKQQPRFTIETSRLESIIGTTKASIRSQYDDIVNVRHKCVGVAAGGAGI
jgi:superfamily II DNA/RNA helicase